MNKKWEISLMIGIFFIALATGLAFIYIRHHRKLLYGMGAIPTPPELAKGHLWCGKNLVLIQRNPSLIETEKKVTILNLTSNDVDINIESFCPQIKIATTDFILKGEESKEISIIRDKNELESCETKIVSLTAKQETCKDVVRISIE